MNKNPPANAWSSSNQPTPGNRRGKEVRTKALNALKRVKNWSEDELYDHIVKEAFVNNDKDMAAYVCKLVIPPTKPTFPNYTFQYDAKLPYHEKCEVILESVASGDIPPDVGNDLIVSIKHVASVKEMAELEKRLADLEELIRSLTR